MELGCAQHFSHNIVDVFVDGVACDRPMDKRVCDLLSEILRTPPVCLQLVSPLYVGPRVALAQSIKHDLAHGCRDGD